MFHNVQEKKEDYRTIEKYCKAHTLLILSLSFKEADISAFEDLITLRLRGIINLLSHIFFRRKFMQWQTKYIYFIYSFSLASQDPSWEQQYIKTMITK